MHWHPACSPLGYEEVARTWQQGHSLQPTTSIPSWIVALSWQRGLHNWMKLWAKLCRATQDRSQWRVPANHGSVEETMANHSITLAARTPWTERKGKKDMTPEDEPLRSEGVQYVTGMRWLDSITDSMDMNLSKPQEIVEDTGAWCAVVHGVTKGQLSNPTTASPQPQETLSLCVSHWVRPVDTLFCQVFHSPPTPIKNPPSSLQSLAVHDSHEHSENTKADR